ARLTGFVSRVRPAGHTAMLFLKAGGALAIAVGAVAIEIAVVEQTDAVAAAPAVTSGQAAARSVRRRLIIPTTPLCDQKEEDRERERQRQELGKRLHGAGSIPTSSLETRRQALRRDGGDDCNTRF